MSRVEYLEKRAEALHANGVRRPCSGIVVTGFAEETPLGNETETFERMLRGESGIKEHSVNNYRTNVAAQHHFNPLKYVSQRELDKGLTGLSVMEIVVARRAAEMAGLLRDDGLLDTNDRTRVASCIASGFGTGFNVMRTGVKLLDGLDGTEDSHKRAEKMRFNSKRVGGFWGVQMFPEEPNADVAIALGCKGWGINSSEACATSLSSVVEGSRLILDGLADIVIAGGFEDPISDPYKIGVDKVAIATFAAMKATTEGKLGPARSSCPFDKERDGLTLGAGGGAIILESIEHARARGAMGFAEIGGFFKSMDGDDKLKLDVENVARVIMNSLRNPISGLLQIPDVIFAHATSTKEGDYLEAQALYRVFGDLLKKIPITAIKSYIGHLLGGAGIVNLITLVQSLIHNKIPRILNLRNPLLNLEKNEPEDEIIKYMNFVRRLRTKTLHSGLAVGYGFGGYDASVFVRKPAA